MQQVSQAMATHTNMLTRARHHYQRCAANYKCGLRAITRLPIHANAEQQARAHGANASAKRKHEIVERRNMSVIE